MIGSVFLSLYARGIDGSPFAHLSAAAHTAARTSVAAAAQTVTLAPPARQNLLLTGFNASFMSGLHTASAVTTGVCVLGALGARAVTDDPTAAPRAHDLTVVPGSRPD